VERHPDRLVPEMHELMEKFQQQWQQRSANRKK
jgi:hypothetical protein